MTTKRVSETALLTADFSGLLQLEEHIVSCAVDAYAKAGDGYYSEDFDLSSAEYVGVVLKTGGEEVQYKAFPVLGRSIARLVIFGGEQAVSEIIDLTSVSDGKAIDVDEQSATVRITGGVAGNEYRVLFTATTNYGNFIIRELNVSVIAD